MKRSYYKSIGNGGGKGGFYKSDKTDRSGRLRGGEDIDTNPFHLREVQRLQWAHLGCRIPDQKTYLTHRQINRVPRIFPLMQIWDTAGQEKYRSIAPIYYREAKIALCVYDITSQRSYDVMKKWVEELQANGPKDIVLAVVGNKIDRCD